MNHILLSLAMTCIALSGVAFGQRSASPVPAVDAEIDFSDADSITSSKRFRTFKAEWKKIYGVSVGMTVAELKNLIARQNAKTDELALAEIDQLFDRSNHSFREHSPTQRQELSDGKGSVTYWVNGDPQFWMDVAIEEGRVKSIFIAFGNGTVSATPVRLDGTGTYQSDFFKQLAQCVQDLDGKKDIESADSESAKETRAANSD
ncbi:hypothetical protein [Stieleria varia]|nr:hypothetical protein [Stieleria varia]